MRGKSRTALLLMDAATFALAAVTLLAFAGSWHWYIDLFSHFRPQYVIGLAAACAVLLACRQWKTAVLAAIALLLNLSVLLTHAIPSPDQQPVSDASLRVRCVSFNVLQGNESFAEVEQFLRSTSADVGVFQEVSPPWAEALRRLDDVHPHQFLRGRKDSKGAALLSKLPAKVSFEELPGHGPLGAVVGKIEAEIPFTIFGVHSHKPTSRRGAESQMIYFEWLAKRCREENAAGRPVVLMGDLNSTPWARAFRSFASSTHLYDTSRGVLFGATWSASLPHRLLIDHAFVSPEWRLITRSVGPALGSDHRPLIIDLAIPR